MHVKVYYKEEQAEQKIRQLADWLFGTKASNNTPPKTGSYTVSLEKMKEIFPNTNEAKLKPVLEVINAFASDFKINTPIRMANFLGQVGHETGEFSKAIGEKGESGCYTAKNPNWKDVVFKLTWKEDPFSCQCTPCSVPKKGRDKILWNDISEVPKKYICGQGNKQSDVALLSLMYACEGGNGDEASEDGYKYRGKGLLQMTWKKTYVAFDKWLKTNYSEHYQDVVANPDLVSTDPTISVLSAMWEWQQNGLNGDADKTKEGCGANSDAFIELTLTINKGKVGINDRYRIFERAIKILQ